MPTFLLRHGSAEAVHAPELRYLRSWVELQARRAFGELRIAEPSSTAGDLLDQLRPDDRVLWLRNERVLVAERTLRELARALEGAPGGSSGSAQAAAPRSTAEVLGRLEDPPSLYTLRGFERLEARILDGDAEAARSSESASSEPPPVVLATPRGLEQLLDGEGLDEGDLGGDLPLVRAGLYHEFIDYYGEIRSDVLPHVPDGVRRILEVGCGRGVTGELLRRELGADVTGVELNPVVAREAATRLDRVVVGDVEDPGLETEIAHAGPYDLVLALELFEHLATPEGFLERAARWLAPGGTILLSTPNVGHHSVVEDLLAGRWDYLPIGLLCYTHLRFFTRRTLEDWLERLGFEDFELIPQLTEGSPRLEALLEREPLGEGLALDRESLRTRGFYVLVRPESPAAKRGNRPSSDP